MAGRRAATPPEIRQQVLRGLMITIEISVSTSARRLFGPFVAPKTPAMA
jgi:hypothetical protein